MDYIGQMPRMDLQQLDATERVCRPSVTRPRTSG